MADRIGRWRSTALTRADGSPVAVWSTSSSAPSPPIARIYRITDRPQDGQWSWSVLIDAQGRPWNSASENAPSGAEAVAIVERISGYVSSPQEADLCAEPQPVIS
jgi:hypothetical protein